jgi:hypothetical protein
MDEITSKATELGREAGRAAASWVFDGNTDRETYRAVLAGIEDGDPVVLDAYRVPDLSGEFAGEMTPRDLAAELDLDEGEDGDALDAACDAWLDAANEGFWHEVERVARVQLQVREPGYFDCPCCGEIAISADGMDEVCDACADAGCVPTTDAVGDLGWWNCQRDDMDEDEGN